MGMGAVSALPRDDEPGVPRPLAREDVLDGRDVSELLHLPISTVLDYARRGVLPGRKLGRRWIFLRDELERAVRAAPLAREGRDPASTRPVKRAQEGLERYPRNISTLGHRRSNSANRLICSHLH